MNTKLFIILALVPLAFCANLKHAEAFWLGSSKTFDSPAYPKHVYSSYKDQYTILYQETSEQYEGVVFDDDYEEIDTIPFDVNEQVLAFSKDGEFLAAVSSNMEINIWSLKDWSLLATVPTESKPTGLDFSWGGEELAIAYENSTIVIHDGQTFEYLMHVQDPVEGSTTNCVTYVPDGSRFVTCRSADGNEQQIQFWMGGYGNWDTCHAQEVGGDDVKDEIKFSWDSKLFAVHSAKTITIANYGNGWENETYIESSSEFENRGMAFSFDNQFFVYGTPEGVMVHEIGHWDHTEQELVDEDGGRQVRGLDFQDEKLTIAWAHPDAAEPDQVLTIYKFHANGASNLLFSIIALVSAMMMLF